MTMPPIRAWLPAVHHALARVALGAARFITLSGDTRGQRVFWRLGAAISAFGGLVVLASRLGTIAALLTVAAWHSAHGAAALAVDVLTVVWVGYFVAGLIRGIREPLDHDLPGKEPR